MTAHVPVMLLLGLLAGLWVHQFTDHFPAFGSVLGLTGILAVIPALGGLMAPERRKRYSAFLDDVLFQRSASLYVYLVALAVLLVIGFGMVRPLQLKNAQSGAALKVEIVELAGDCRAESIDRRTVPALGSSRLPVWHGLGAGSRDLVLHAAGLPSLRVETEFWRWATITFPEDAWQSPLAVIRPGLADIPGIVQRKPTLEIRVETDSAPCEAVLRDEIPDYVGQAVWVGSGGRSIATPADLLERWQREAALRTTALSARDASKVAQATWVAPQASKIGAIGENAVVHWSLKAKNSGVVLAKGSMGLLAGLRYPQEVQIGTSASPN